MGPIAVVTALKALGVSELENITIEAGNKLVSHCKDKYEWKKMLEETGEFYLGFEKNEDSFFEDLKLVFSKENMVELAHELQNASGYSIGELIPKKLQQLFNSYEIPQEIAESYANRVMLSLLYQIREIDPDKYDRFFQQEWRDEENAKLAAIEDRLKKIEYSLTEYRTKGMRILSAGELDLQLRKQTANPSIGIEFFEIDDDAFHKVFEEKKDQCVIRIKCKCREEAVYCILNELWKIHERRPIYVVTNIEDWKNLHELNERDNVYIPMFPAHEIVAIPDNTNIFLIDDNTPVITKDYIQLRPRTRDNLIKQLELAGLDYSEAYKLVKDTHGLYIPMKKRIFNGAYLKKPEWLDGISTRAKEVCLLVGQWEEKDGDIAIIEDLYGGAYKDLWTEVEPYTKGEDPFLYVINRRNERIISLESPENTWDYMSVSIENPLWKRFSDDLLEVLSESESMFTYEAKERLIAQFRGEKLFWSKTLRIGMLHTIILKLCYKGDEDCQWEMDQLVKKILDCFQCEKQWDYLSFFIRQLCEISPTAIMDRVECELSSSTGFLELFMHQSGDFIFGRNAYIEFLWALEMLLTMPEHCPRAIRILFKLSTYNFTYKSNSISDIFDKVFCPWVNFSAFENSDKIMLAEKAFLLDNDNAWNYIFKAIPSGNNTMIGNLSEPKYREHCNVREVYTIDLWPVTLSYVRNCLANMDFSTERWSKMLELSTGFDDSLYNEIAEKLMFEISQMNDQERATIKKKIRDIIYRHRYFRDADWSMEETKIQRYITLLDEILLEIKEYDYGYLFGGNASIPLMNPIPYNEQEAWDQNEKMREKLIKSQLEEFKVKEYNLERLIEICADNTSYTTLGKYLARIWDNGKWNYELFKLIYSIQPSGQTAVDYMAECLIHDVGLYPEVIMKCQTDGIDDNTMAMIYAAEAQSVATKPLVLSADDNVKKLFWRGLKHWNNSFDYEMLQECKRFADIDTFLHQLYLCHHRNPVPVEDLYEYFEDIEKMPRRSSFSAEWQLEQLLEILQLTFIDDEEKCNRLSHLEIIFMNIIGWEKMKCFRHLIYNNPEMYAEFIAVSHRNENGEYLIQDDQSLINNMYHLYDEIKFCPVNSKGDVEEEHLRNWLYSLQKALEKTKHDYLFGSILGRMFAYAPSDPDGNGPCLPVKRMIEEFYSKNLESSFITYTKSKRGMFTVTAGKGEAEIARRYKEIAEKIKTVYPMVAQIYYGLYHSYQIEANDEREQAEYGLLL